MGLIVIGFFSYCLVLVLVCRVCIMFMFCIIWLKVVKFWLLGLCWLLKFSFGWLLM